MFHSLSHTNVEIDYTEALEYCLILLVSSSTEICWDIYNSHETQKLFIFPTHYQNRDTENGTRAQEWHERWKPQILSKKWMWDEYGLSWISSSRAQVPKAHGHIANSQHTETSVTVTIPLPTIKFSIQWSLCLPNLPLIALQHHLRHQKNATGSSQYLLLQKKKKKNQTQTKPLSTIPMPCSQPPSKPPPLPHSGGLAMN